MIGEILGGIMPSIGRMIGGSGQQTQQMPTGQEFLSSYLDTLDPIWDEEEQFYKDYGKKQKKKANKMYKAPKAEQARLVNEIGENYDRYTDSLMDAAMRGEISGDEVLGKMEEWEALGLLNPGSVINKRGDTSFSKKVAAEKKILEEVNPRQRAANASLLANTIMGKNLSPEEQAYYTNATMFKSPEDIAAAMKLTEAGDTRFYRTDDEESFARKWGGRIVNPTSKNIDNMPYHMRKGLPTNPAQQAAVTAARIG